MIYKISYSSFQLEIYKSKINFFAPVIEQLTKSGVDSNFIYTLLSDTKTQFNERFVKINVTGYLNKVDYSDNYNRYSVNSSKKFIENNIELLNRCEKIYDIPKEIISSIIWIETKNGTILGNNHLPSVFLSAAMSNQPYFIDMNLKILRETVNSDTTDLKFLEQKLIKRAANKSLWAISELIALERMQKSSNISVLDLTGSWAGAFGIPQFLPSSYMKWAVDGNGDNVINLFELDDAIFSVANYLKENGWGKSLESQRAAVFLYNNSTDYVDAVLRLAGKLKPKPVSETDSLSNPINPTEIPISK